MAGPRRKAPLTRTQALAGYLEKTLLPDLRLRAEEPAVAAVLAERWSYERAQKRTAAALPEWTDQTLTQVAVAWVLSAVFVRVLEDRGLVAQRRLAGGDATDSERLFYEMFAGLGARDYLAAVFNEVAHAPVLRDLLGPAGNPAWKLGPSHAAVLELFKLLRDADASGALTWRFDDRDTRFLGDLYQDLSAEVRERFALLQTPDFVERFILDRTLDPAVAASGLAAVRVIDPTCGSGHFLLGSFGRLVGWMREARPADDLRDVALAALGRVYGSDINPYAVAIARFRLLLAYVELCGVTRIADAPELPPLTQNVVVADSLLLGGTGSGELMELALDVTAQASWGPRAFDFVDPPAVRNVFHQRYHAVVGNPPYIVCRDAALRETYRKGYPDSASGKFALAAPFTERFFKLAVDGGCVGLINSNSFMKREFGKKLIEIVLKKLDLTEVIDSAGAYIPGHGTPTVILFGHHRAPATDAVRVVMGRRGEPETPAVPAKGKVWSSIVAHDRNVGFEDEYITVADVQRTTLAKHPWSLGGGGAGDLKELIEERCPTRLGMLSTAIGFDAIMGEDELFTAPSSCWQRYGLSDSHTRSLVEGEPVRDWAIGACDIAIFPYDQDLNPSLPAESSLTIDHFWKYKQNLIERRQFGKNTLEAGLQWFEYRSFYKSKRSTAISITFAFVATHNHFVLDRGGKVFKQSAPIIKLPAAATEDDHFALLGWLNSSAVCFWMKQVSHDKGSGSDTGKWQAEPAKIAFEFSGGSVEKIPVFASDGSQTERILSLARSLDRLAEQRSRLLTKLLPMIPTRSLSGASELRDLLAVAESTERHILQQQITLQEEIDWTAYALLGLADDLMSSAVGLEIDALAGTPLGARPFEMLLARQGQALGIDGQLLASSPPDTWVAAQRDLWERRLRAIEQTPLLPVVEVPDYKRRWLVTPKDLAGRVWTFDDEIRRYLQQWIADRIEAAVRQPNDEQIVTLHDVVSILLTDSWFIAALEYQVGGEGTDVTTEVSKLVNDDSIPYLAALRHTDTGLTKRARWEHTWALQRREDAGDPTVGDIPVPPKYDHEDYREARYWSLRGKLDVPRERFIAYPGAELDPRAPVFGWAGWNHLQRARALAALYQRRKTDDGWDRARLRPLLAGLQELLPWLKQWHNEPDAELDGLRQGDVWAEFLEGERAALGWSEDDLRAWRPSAPARKERAKKAPKAKAPKGNEAE